MRLIQGMRPGLTEMPTIQVGVSRRDGAAAGAPGGMVGALVDTGANETCLRMDVLNRYAIPAGKKVLPATGAFGATTAKSAWIDLVFVSSDQADSVTLDLEVAVFAEMSEPLILGWSALRHFDLRFTRDGTFQISW